MFSGLKKIKNEYLSIFSVIAFSIFSALYFQIAWQYPVIDGFPLAERLLDSNYLPNDFYTNTFDDYSPRMIVANFYVLGSRFFNVHYTEFVAVANILRIFVTFIALYYLYLGLIKNRLISLIALSISSVSFLFVPQMPAWWPLVYDLTGASMAEMALMIAWASIVFGRLFVAYIAIAVALLFHPLAGIHGFIIGLLLLYSQRGFLGVKQELVKPYTYVGGLLMTSTFLLNYIPYLNSLNGFKLDDDVFVNIIVNFRHPHHYLPTHFDWQAWLSFSIFVLFFIYMWWKIKYKMNNNRVVAVIFSYAIMLMLLGWLFVEVFPTRLGASLIPFRGFPILIPIFVLVTASYMYDKIINKEYVSFILLLLPFIPYNSVGLTWFIFPGYHELMLPSVIVVIVFLFVVLFDFNDSLMLRANEFFEPLLAKDNIYKYISLFSIIVVLFALIKIDIFIPSLKNSPNIYAWLSTNATVDDIIVSELNAGNNQKIRLISKKSVVVSKDFPFLEKYYIEWYERYSDVYFNLKKSRGYVDSSTAQKLHTVMSKYQATLLLRTKKINDVNLFTLIGEADGEKAKVYIYRINMSY